MSINSNKDLSILSKDEQEFLWSLYFDCGYVLGNVFRTVLELKVFEIISKAGTDAELSPEEIAGQLPAGRHEGTSAILDRMLHFLASYSILKCTYKNDNNNGGGSTTRRLYGLAPLSKFLVPDHEGFSRAPPAEWFNDRALNLGWSYLKDAVVEGGTPFNKANGMNMFDYLAQNDSSNRAFNDAMLATSTLWLSEVLDSYKGFENCKEIVDVGGGYGSTLQMIISKYPFIKGVNFDLPQVIRNAPPVPGVRHVEGDMLESVPQGETMLIMRVLHNWTDEHCLKVLKNCWEGLPESGKVIAIEMILPESSETEISSRIALTVDLVMFNVHPGGKERTAKEFDALAKGAGFISSNVVCRTSLLSVIEFYKS
ncbi:OLC1v1005827C1 [Oldenlandia corymbosa var. corymbosa]|uniref:OLC1v1005827C1 n=1 Tax=Oldenlandia corymbosa var. corymbosa TaxID=529605 RepID=A0AAV1DHI9_OLDCO|nr:OLC1v1005827C1 [Oldenlandia corymbosa var. corymbosa]